MASAASPVTAALGFRVLVVDDVDEVRQMFSGYLRRYGMEVFGADNGVSGLSAAHRVAPTVIVTDIDMPDMDGLEMCRQLRADPPTKDLVVVAVTGNDVAAEAYAAGCDAVLQKPCSCRLLVDTISSLVHLK